MQIFLFAYGTLQHSSIQMRLLSRLLQGVPDSLNGYRQEQIELDETYPILVADPHYEESVPGIRYEIFESELDILDRYEGSAYRRALVILNSGIEAWVYVQD